MKKHLMAFVDMETSTSSQPAMAPVRSSNAIGIACALTASLSFTLNDVGIKFLSGGYALHQIVFIRTLMALAITALIIIPLEGGFALLRTNQIGMHLLRAAFVVFANMSFFMGLAALPLSEATAIFFISPLVITIFSVIFLGEKVGPRRWTAVALGLLGAFVMLRPGSHSFQLAAILPMMAACAYAGLHILTRKMGRTEKASTLAFYTQLFFLLFSMIIGLFLGSGWLSGNAHPSIAFVTRAWVVPSQWDLQIMLAVGVASAIGGYFVTQAYRLSEAALIAPFEYVALALAILWGITIFGEWPDTLAWTGMSMILGAGLFIVWSESRFDKSVRIQGPLPRQR